MKIQIDATDIIQHLPTLAQLATECEHITEMGMREGASTTAFAEGIMKGILISIDIVKPPQIIIDILRTTCADKGVEFKFILGDTRKIIIEETDLLFIDTDHTNKQLTKELKLHSDKARKYIVLHDTESCKSELWPVVEKLTKKGKWKIKQHYQNCNGLTVLERI